MLYSAEEALFFKTIQDFAKQEVAPYVKTMDEHEVLDPTLVNKIFQMGLMNIEIPEVYGGSESSFFNAILAIQALAQVDPAVSVFVDVQNTLVANALMRWGHDDLKKRYLTLLCQGHVGSYCLTEAGSGSDAFALKTKATEDGDSYVLNGQKIFITNAGEAEVFLVFATVNPQAGYKGVTCFVVEKSKTPGFSIGKKEKKLGIRASSTCEVILNNCKIPKSQILGTVGQGYKVAIETLNEGRIGIAAQMLGLAEGAFGQAVKYTKDRQQFGQPLDRFQSVQFEIAEMATKIQATRLMVYHAARLKDEKQPFSQQAAMAKLFASEAAEYVASLALELHGGYGFTKDFPAEKFYRDAKIGKIYEGTSHMQKSTIAKMILDDY